MIMINEQTDTYFFIFFFSLAGIYNVVLSYLFNNFIWVFFLFFFVNRLW